LSLDTCHFGLLITVLSGATRRPTRPWPCAALAAQFFISLLISATSALSAGKVFIRVYSCLFAVKKWNDTFFCNSSEGLVALKSEIPTILRERAAVCEPIVDFATFVLSYLVPSAQAGNALDHD
jgi:hypothetical protein